MISGNLLAGTNSSVLLEFIPKRIALRLISELEFRGYTVAQLEVKWVVAR